MLHLKVSDISFSCRVMKSMFWTSKVLLKEPACNLCSKEDQSQWSANVYGTQSHLYTPSLKAGIETSQEILRFPAEHPRNSLVSYASFGDI